MFPFCLDVAEFILSMTVYIITLDIFFSFLFFRMPTTSRGLYHWLFHSGTSLEDFSDRLNHFWTFGLLLVLGGTISWKYGFQDPITCWTPAEFTSSHVDFAQHICWNTYTYYKPLLLPDIPRLDHYRPVLQYTYFQALPVILCLQALLFKLPHILLHVCHCYSGTSFDKIAGLTDGYENLSLEGRGNLANQIARYIHRWCRMFPHGLPWRWLTVIWFLTKCLFCINIIIQLTYIDRFLQVNEEQQYIKNETLTSYGDVIYDNIAKNNGSFWRESPVFPRMILCDFQVPMFRNVHMYTVQCALNVNNFTEHAYMFLWVWLLFVAIVTILSCAVWTIRTLLPFGRQRYEDNA